MARTTTDSGCRLTRRKMLQATWKGSLGLGLASLVGCGQTEDEQKNPETSDSSAPSVERGLVRPVQSSWYSALADGLVRCELCPHQCVLPPSARGACRVRENKDGHLFTLVHSNPVMVEDSPVERNPFFHVRPGTRSLSVSTAGCNLNCQFCEVWDMAFAAPEEVHAHDLSPARVVEHAQVTNVETICYSFGEPVVFFEYMADTAVLAKEAGLLNLMQTAGYIEPEPLATLLPFLDGVNIDLKGFDPEFYRTAVGGELRYVLRTMELISKAGIHMEITNLLIPTLNDHPDTIAAMCRWIVNELGPDVPLHFARFYPLYKLMDLPRTPIATLDQARQIAQDTGLRYVYVARVPGHEGENTFCPACGEKIIARQGFIVDQIHLEGNRCAFCHTSIPGLL